MKFLKGNWFKISLIALALGAFYWYELRPANIRAICKSYVSDNRLDLTSDLEKQELGMDMNKINAAEREKATFWYKDCLNAKGLEE